MICIYCLQDKIADGFKKREHVLPQSFGAFKPNNLILKEVVCDECNQYFGDNLETDLARDTYEGSIARYDHGIKKPSEFKSLGKKSRMKFRVQEGQLKGAYGHRVYVPEKGRICLEPLPQVGFLKADSSGYNYFLLDEIPSHIFFNNQVHNISNPRGIETIGCDHKTAEDALTRKGYSFGSGRDHNTTYIQPGACKVYGKNDQKIARAIAKIGFNYLAYCKGSQFVLKSDFDSMRKYIRTGEYPDFNLLHVSKEAISPDKFLLGYRRKAHIITVHRMFYNISALFVSISLFNWASYTIRLVNKLSDNEKEIVSGHIFNLDSKNIDKLGLRESR